MNRKTFLSWIGGLRVFPGAAIYVAAVVGVMVTEPIGAQEAVSGEQATPPVNTARSKVDVVNQVTQTAVQLGALTCAAKVQQVTSFLGVTSDTRASLRRPLNPPDRNSLSLAMTIATDGTTGIALADFYPVQGGCKATYSLTVNLPESCSDLRTNGFGALTDENKLADNITLLAGPNTLRVILIGSGEECTVTKTETLD